jgi:hypothetical protein
VRIALKGFTKEWEVFVKSVVGRENLPDWRRLWDDFTQEEIQEGSQSSGQNIDGANENVTLTVKRNLTYPATHRLGMQPRSPPSNLFLLQIPSLVIKDE